MLRAPPPDDAANPGCRRSRRGRGRASPVHHRGRSSRRSRSPAREDRQRPHDRLLLGEHPVEPEGDGVGAAAHDERAERAGLRVGIRLPPERAHRIGRAARPRRCGRSWRAAVPRSAAHATMRAGSISTISSTTATGTTKRSSPHCTVNASTMATVSGIRRMNVVPSSGLVVSSSSPPSCRTTIFWTMSMPMPRPLVDVLARESRGRVDRWPRAARRRRPRPGPMRARRPRGRSRRRRPRS